MSPGTLRQDLYNKKRKRPGVEKLISIADIIGCDYNEFWDTPPPEGVPVEQWEKSSAMDRALALEILDALRGLPDAEKRLYMNLFKQGIAIGRLRMESENGDRLEKTPSKTSR